MWDRDHSDSTLVPWADVSKKQVQRRRCEIENVSFFALELGTTKGEVAYEELGRADTYVKTIYGTAHNANGTQELKYGTGTLQDTVQLSLELANESTLDMFVKDRNELAIVKDWDRCQMELDSDDMMSPKELDGELWKADTQVRVFYGGEGEESSQSCWDHRKPQMRNVQDLSDVATTDSRRKIAREAIQTVEHILVDENPENFIVYFDLEAPLFSIGCDMQLPRKGHVSSNKPMLGAGLADEPTHKRTMRQSSQVDKFAEEMAGHSGDQPL